MSRWLCWWLCGVLLGLQTARADEKTEAERVVRETVDKVLQVLKRTDLEKTARREETMRLINPVFDFDLMAKLTIGKENWGRFSGDQRREFTALFVARLRNTYLDKAEMYSEEAIEIKDTVVANGKVQVTTMVAAKDKPFTIVYKLYPAGNAWKVYDVEIEGVSVVSSYRRDYSEALKTKSVDEFLRQLREAAGDQGGPAKP